MDTRVQYDVQTYADLEEDRQQLTYERRMLELQRKYSMTPPGQGVDFDAQEGLLAERERVLEQHRTQDALFSSSYDIPLSLFVGREHELRDIQGLLMSGKRVVVLSGIGGIGKSALAKEYARRNGAEYDAVLIIPASPSLSQCFAHDTHLSSAEPPYSSKRYASRREYGRRKFACLCKMLERHHCLVILDDVTKGEPYLLDLLAQPADFLITTRRASSELFARKAESDAREVSAVVAELVLEGLDATDCQGFFQSALAERKNEEAGEDTLYAQFLAFSKEVLYHPLSMELWLRADHANRSGAQMARVAPASMGDARSTAFQLDMIRGLTPQERKALLWLSLLPETGVNLPWFLSFTGISEHVLAGLIARSQVRCYEEMAGNGYTEGVHVLVHPVLRSCVIRSTDVSVNKVKELLICLARDVEHAWTEPREVNQRKEESVLWVLKRYPPTVPWMAETFDLLITFLWIEEYYSEAQRYALQLFRAVESYYGSPHQMVAFAALRTGAAFFNDRKFAEADVWYRRALTELEECEPFNKDYDGLRVTALNKCARTLQNEGDQIGAWELVAQALRVAERCQMHHDEPRWQLKLAYLYRRAAVLLLQRDRKRADEYLAKMHDAAERVYLSEHDRAIRVADMGETDALFLQDSERYEEAAEVLRKNVDTYRTYRGPMHEDTLHAKELLADALVLCGDESGAREILQDVLDALKEHFPLDRVWMRRVADKLR